MELASISLEWLVFLFAVALIAGFLDTLAGGGGLLTVPALIMSGMPPLSALATNKLQSSFGTATATLIMLRSKRIGFREIKYLMLAAFIGSCVGTVVIQFIDTSLLRFIIPLVLILIAVYFLLSPTPQKDEREPSLSIEPYRYLVVPAIGF